MATIQTFRRGQTYCAVLAHPKFKYLVVTNNTEVWSARASTDWYDALDLEDGDLATEGRAREGIELERLEPEFRLPIAWARRAVKEPSKTYATPAPAGARAASMAYARDATRALGSVRYAGFEQYRASASHSLADVHATVDAAVEKCLAAWGWAPRNLEVKFHEDSRSMGLAYEPGSLASQTAPRISLHARLLREYDLPSMMRTLLHELCHHYRESSFPRSEDPHDAVFCRELAKVDAVVAGAPRGACVQFTDERDLALVASIESRRAGEKRPPAYDPALGYVRVTGSGAKTRVEWAPRAARAWAPKRQPLQEVSLIELLRHFKLRDWGRVAVEYEVGLSGHGGIETLSGLAERMMEMYPKHTRTLRQYAALRIETEGEGAAAGAQRS